MAAAVALLLLAGGLTYAALRDTDGEPTPTVPTATTGAPTTTEAPTTPAPTTETTSASPSASTTPPVSVLLFVRAVRDSYTGSCPPPEERAPAFTATVTVDRTPATVSYRWATGSGEGEDDGWRTLEFPEGGPTERRLERTQAGQAAGAEVRDRIRLEVREPVARQSNWVAFSVSCTETASPSAPPSTSATPSGGTASPGTGGGGAVPLTPRR